MQERVIPHIQTSPAVRIAGYTLLTALGARIAMPLPYTTVPVTWQVAAVLFSGLMLGSRAGFASQLAYLVIGLAGAPVFANGAGGFGYLLNPMGTGGYLLAMPIAAWVVGYISERFTAKGATAQFIACLVGVGVVYTFGCIWLSSWLHLSIQTAVLAGAGWFLLWDIAKTIIVVTLARNAGRNERA